MKKSLLILVCLLILMQLPIMSNAALGDPASVDALKFTTAPTFDGVVTEAEWGQPTLKDVVAGTPTQAFKTANAPDLKWSAWLRWDATYLYVAMQTPDTKHSNKQEGAALWGGDSMQLKIDPLGNWQSQGKTEKTFASTKALDVIFVLSSVRNASESYCWNEGKKAAIDGAKVAVKNENNLTTYEVAIPWAYMDTTAEAAKVIGLAIGRLSSSNDDTNPDTAYDGCLEWGSGTIYGRNDEAICGTNKITLSNTAAITPATEPNTQTGDTSVISMFIITAVLASTVVVLLAKREKFSRI